MSGNINRLITISAMATVTLFTASQAMDQCCTLCKESTPSCSVPFQTLRGEYAHKGCYALIEHSYNKYVLDVLNRSFPIDSWGRPQYSSHTEVHKIFVCLLKERIKSDGFATIKDFARRSPDYDVQDVFQELGLQAMQHYRTRGTRD